MWSCSKAVLIIQKFWKSNGDKELIRGYLNKQKNEK